MAAKGGGSWKVAYADFVTAMMAFFLVMWIAAQDPKIRQAVARYFDNPVSFDQWGDSRQPDKRGSLHDAPSSGSVPLAEAVALGKGRNTYTQGGISPSTKVVSDWIHVDEKALKYWRENAKREMEWAAMSREVKEKLGTVYEVAVWRLSKRLREEVALEIPAQNKGVFRDLILEALSTVNWTQVAEDLVAR